MATIVELLLETARADTDLLLVNGREGDLLATPREVDFLLLAPSAEKAQIVASFINDNRYGVATAVSDEDAHRVTVHIEMPITQNVICSVSGLMACISKIFGLDYDGWESPIQRG
jgi:hypothetical protein